MKKRKQAFPSRLLSMSILALSIALILLTLAIGSYLLFGSELTGVTAVLFTNRQRIGALSAGICLLISLILLAAFRQLQSLGRSGQTRDLILHLLRQDEGQLPAALIELMTREAGARAGVLLIFVPDERPDVHFFSGVENDRLPYSALEYLSPQRLGSMLTASRNPDAQLVRVRRLPFTLNDHDKPAGAPVGIVMPVRSGRNIIAAVLLVYPYPGTGIPARRYLRDLLAMCSIPLRSLYSRQKEHSMLVRSTRDARKMSSRLSDIFEHSRDAIVLCRADGTITDINQAGLELAGFGSREQLIGKSLQDYYSSGMDQKKLMQYLFSSARGQELELIFQQKDGSLRYGLASPGFERSPGYDIEEFFLIIKDITERIIRDAQLMKSNTELELLTSRLRDQQAQIIQQEKLASLGQLSAGIAHEINNPLGFLLSNIESLDYMVKDGGKADVAEMKEIISESREGLRRIGSIVRSLREFSHSGESDEPQQINIPGILENTLTVAANFYKYCAEIELEINYEDTVPGFPDRLSQVFLNLILNSAQAIQSQHREDLGHIRIRVDGYKRFVQFLFCDDGPGIEDHIIQKIFDPFFTTKDVGQGTGLGLSISRDIIVKLHKGRIEVQSSPGKGCCFRILIPRDREDDAREAQELPG